MIVGFTHGVFDLLHPGHLYLFQQASNSCDYLIVGVNSDASVKRLKGPLRPAESLFHRMERIHECATSYVGAVVPFEGDKYAMLKNIAPQRYFLGYDQVRTRTADWMMTEIQCELIVIDHLPGYSTSLQLDAARSKTNA